MASRVCSPQTIQSASIFLSDEEEEGVLEEEEEEESVFVRTLVSVVGGLLEGDAVEEDEEDEDEEEDEVGFGRAVGCSFCSVTTGLIERRNEMGEMGRRG
jgi:hypothetical protein